MKNQKTIYLNVGVTGKQFQRAMLDANKNHKVDATTFSYCLRRALEFEGGALKLIKGFDASELTPKTLIPLRNEKRKNSTAFSVFEIYNLIRKFYKQKNAQIVTAANVVEAIKKAPTAKKAATKKVAVAK
jgi:hypothetical protein